MVQVLDPVHQAIDSYLIESGSYQGTDYADKGVHSSQIGRECKRFIIMKYFGFKETPETFEERLMFYRGKKIHDLVTKSFEESDAFDQLAHDFDLSEFFPENFVGECDNIVFHKDTETVKLIEVKTAMPNQLKTYVSKLPHEHHIVQLLMYRKALDTADIKKLRIDTNEIHYFDAAGTNKPMKFSITSGYTFLDGLMREIQTYIDQYKLTKVLPDKVGLDIKIDENNKVTAMTKWDCRYCHFRDISCESYNRVFDKVKVVGKVVNDVFICNKRYDTYRELLTEEVERSKLPF